MNTMNKLNTRCMPKFEPKNCGHQSDFWQDPGEALLKIARTSGSRRDGGEGVAGPFRGTLRLAIKGTYLYLAPDLHFSCR